MYNSPAGRLQPGQSLRATVHGRDLHASVSYLGLEPAARSDQGPRYELIAEIVPGDKQLLRVGDAVILHLDE